MNRFRRLRKTDAMRNLVRETSLSANDFIQPFFVVEGQSKKEEIASLPVLSLLSGTPKNKPACPPASR